MAVQTDPKNYKRWEGLGDAEMAEEAHEYLKRIGELHHRTVEYDTYMREGTADERPKKGPPELVSAVEERVVPETDPLPEFEKRRLEKEDLSQLPDEEKRRILRESKKVGIPDAGARQFDHLCKALHQVRERSAFLARDTKATIEDTRKKIRASKGIAPVEVSSVDDLDSKRKEFEAEIDGDLRAAFKAAGVLDLFPGAKAPVSNNQLDDQETEA